MLRLNWDSLSQVKNIKMPIFYISGDQDTFVPFEMTLKLAKETKNSIHKEMYIVRGGDHNNTFAVGGREYLRRLREFLETAARVHNQIGTRS